MNKDNVRLLKWKLESIRQNNDIFDDICNILDEILDDITEDGT